MGRALIGVMVGELHAATAGIGFMITVAGATFHRELFFAISGMTLIRVIDRYEQRFDKWRPKMGAGIWYYLTNCAPMEDAKC